MNKISITSILFFLVLPLNLPACGSKSSNTPGDQPATATVKLMTQGTPSGSSIAGVEAVLHLPPGVSVKATQNPPQTDTGVVAASGVAATAGANTIIGTYLASSNTLTVLIPNATDFGVGEFATVTCDIAAGKTMTTSNAGVTNLSVWDINGALVTGLTASFSVTVN